MNDLLTRFLHVRNYTNHASDADVAAKFGLFELDPVMKRDRARHS